MSESPLENNPDNDNRLQRFGELTGLELVDPTRRVEAIKHADPDQFLSVLSVVNGLLRDQGEFTRWKGPNHAVVNLNGSVSLDPPADSHEIFSQFFTQMQTIVEPTEESLKKAAVQTYFAVLGAHMFEDGNGRLARTAYYWIKDGKLPDDVDKVLKRGPGQAEVAARFNGAAIATLANEESPEITEEQLHNQIRVMKDEDDIIYSPIERMKWLAARRVLSAKGRWGSDNPKLKINESDFTPDELTEYGKEYENVKREWLRQYIEIAGRYVDGAAKYIEMQKQPVSQAA